MFIVVGKRWSWFNSWHLTWWCSWCNQASHKILPRSWAKVCSSFINFTFLSYSTLSIKDKTGNIFAGLVVDRDVTSPHKLDFYLQSHPGLKGSECPKSHLAWLPAELSKSKPAEPLHCVVQWTQFWHRRVSLFVVFGFSFLPHLRSRIQQISYFLCYAYARCTRSVSIPAPVYCKFCRWKRLYWVSSVIFRCRRESCMSYQSLVLLTSNIRLSALVPVSTSTRVWDSPTLVVAVAIWLALTFPCGRKASTHRALKPCTLSEGEAISTACGRHCPFGL